MLRFIVLAIFFSVTIPPQFIRAETDTPPVCGGGVSFLDPKPGPLHLAIVAPEQSRLHFIKDPDGKNACPNATPACAAKAFVVAGDSVVVANTHGDYACVTFTNSGRIARSTGGWLPRSALKDAPAATVAIADWAGDWQTGQDDQEFKIKVLPGDRVSLEGTATWGGNDPQRVKNGDIHAGAISVTTPVKGGAALLSVDDDGKAQPFDKDYGETNDGACRIYFTRMGPYLIVEDNLRCGGANVTFTGVYRQEGK